MMRPDLIKHRVAVVIITQLAELPEQLGKAILVTDGVPHNHPTGALNGIHQERLFGGVEQQ